MFTASSSPRVVVARSNTISGSFDSKGTNPCPLRGKKKLSKKDILVFYFGYKYFNIVNITNIITVDGHSTLP